MKKASIVILILFYSLQFNAQNSNSKDICKEKNISLIRWEVEKNNEKAIEFYNKLGAKIKQKGIFRWNLKASS